MSHRIWRFFKKLLIGVGVLLVLLVFAIGFLAWYGSRISDEPTMTVHDLAIAKELPSDFIDLPPTLLEIKGAPGERRQYRMSTGLVMVANESNEQTFSFKNITSLAFANDVLSVSRFGQIEMETVFLDLQAMTLIDNEPVLMYDSRVSDKDQLVDAGQRAEFEKMLRTVAISVHGPTGNIADVYFEDENGEPIEDPKTIDWAEQLAMKEQILLPDYPVSVGDQWAMATQIVPLGALGRAERNYNAELIGFARRGGELLAVIGGNVELSLVESPEMASTGRLLGYDGAAAILFSVDRGIILKSEEQFTMTYESEQPEGPVVVTGFFTATVELTKE
ncbi:MAG: hypothetical protein IIA05_10925 [Proteobacteria bacterium]|nr:hypothetical protein [Pseudomonadota bacterium]